MFSQLMKNFLSSSQKTKLISLRWKYSWDRSLFYLDKKRWKSISRLILFVEHRGVALALVLALINANTNGFFVSIIGQNDPIFDGLMLAKAKQYTRLISKHFCYRLSTKILQLLPN